MAAAMAAHAAMAQGERPSGPHQSPYAGQESRGIKSLSAEDIAELRRGGGWGLARAAELNGVPGPAHLLELQDEIGLSTEQRGAITALYEEMKAAAIAEGERLIALEQALEDDFRGGAATEERLRASLADIAQSRERLRFIHLRTHLRTPTILTAQQIARYNVLRGYAQDPCANRPAGHDPAMWRRHNGCD